MDPLAALSLAAAVAQFVDFGFKILNGAREIHGSLGGATAEDRQLETATREMQLVLDKLVAPMSETPIEEEKLLAPLVAECHTLSAELLALLDKIRARDPKSKIRSTMASFKSKFYEKEKQALQRRLEQCRVRLEQLLSALSRSKTKESLQQLIASSNTNTHDLATIRSHIEDLRSGASLTSIGPVAQKQMRQLLGLSEEVYSKTAQRKVLGLLAFAEMRTRADIVEKAHEATFKWMFEDQSSADQDQAGAQPARVVDPKARARVDSFVQWLSSGSGIYHIAGKLGCGKSTLMKYLAGHSRVLEELQRWAGTSKLAVASFFFWRRGTPLQRSLSGLFRTLLHDILEQRPNLIPVVLPDLWNEVSSSPMWDAKVFALDTPTVQSAFSRLLQCTALYEDSRFVLFIDGLDEYEETRQDDFKAMVQLLRAWTETAPHAVKLCVSSREENVFMNFFSDDQRLRLQDLTLHDMRLYVRDKLQELDPGHLNRLVQIITAKANGIFLWVALVVKSIRGSLEDGYGASHIEAEVNSLPEELEGLFQNLLDSVSKNHREMAYQTFAMVRLYSERATCMSLGARLSLLAYSFLEEYQTDPEFAEKDHHFFGGHSKLARLEREEAAQKRLNARCRGLVELDNYAAIDFTHRSVVEFLDASKARLDGFRPAHALSQLILAEVRSRPKDIYWTGMPGDYPFPRISFLLDELILLRRGAKLNSPPFSFLEALRSAANLILPEPSHPDIPWFKVLAPTGYKVDQWYPASVLHKAVKFGMYEFLDSTISTDRGQVYNEDVVGCLVSACIQKHLQGKEDQSFRMAIVLLRKVPAALHAMPYTMSYGFTFWHELVVCIFCSTRISHEGGIFLLESLRQGADPDCRFLLEDDLEYQSLEARSAQALPQTANGFHLPEPNRKAPKRNLRIVFGSGIKKKELPAKDDYGSFSDVSAKWERILTSEMEISRAFFNLFRSKRQLSFEEWIEFHDFEHKAAVLELCAQRRRASAAHALPANTSSTTPPSATIGDTTKPEASPAPTELGGTGPEISTPPSPAPQLPPLAEVKEAASAEPMATGPAEPQEDTPSRPVALAHKEPARALVRRLLKSPVVDTLLVIVAALVLGKLLQRLS